MAATSSYLSFAHASGSPSRKDLVRTEVRNVVSYLNSKISDHEFRFDDLGNTGINAGSWRYSDTTSGETRFIRDVLEALVDGGEILPYENVVIAHARLGFGYGQSLRYTIDGETYYGAAVYAGGLLVRNYEIKGFTWHEAAHNYTAQHRHGRFALQSDADGVSNMYRITPMSYSYLYSRKGVVDTGFPGSLSQKPATFCDARDNDTYDYRYRRKSYNHVYDRYSKCTRRRIQRWADNV